MAQPLCEFCGWTYNEACVLVCGHSFHARCIHEWSVYGKGCPLCRIPFQCTQHPHLNWLEEIYFQATQAQQVTIGQLEADIQQLTFQHELDQAQRATDRAIIEEHELQIQAQSILLLLSAEDVAYDE